jgi:hypothetical protein
MLSTVATIITINSMEDSSSLIKGCIEWPSGALNGG